jgi:hypothetical protein
VIWLADISNHQGDISIEQIVAEGYSAVICKASEGTTFRDGWFDGWIPRIRDAGAIPGAYHFLRAGDGAGQARIFWARVADHGGPAGFLCALDNEADASWEDTRAFAAEWNAITGGHPLLMYTGGWWWRPRGWPGAELTPHLWHSNYVSGSGTGAALYGQVTDAHWSPGYGGWPQATILQFSSSAQVAGQTVDVNAFRGSLSELLALTGQQHEGDDMSERASNAIEAWSVGSPKAADGYDVAPVIWQQRLERWQGEVSAQLAAQRGELQALTAAFQALATGGTSVDTSAVLAAVAGVRQLVEEEHAAELAAARAEVEARTRDEVGA